MMAKFCLLLCYCAVDYACIGKPMNHGKVLPLAMLLFISDNDYACIGEPMMVKLYQWCNRSKLIDATAAGCCTAVDMAMDSSVFMSHLRW